MPLRTRIALFKVVAVAEALSWVGLLAGMYLKHVAGTTELGVEIFGPIHGVVFLGYVALALLLPRPLRWGRWVTLLALACSVPPFATLAFEVWAARTGRLTAPDGSGVRGAAGAAGDPAADTAGSALAGDRG